jgi:hypothetical protein
MECRSEFSIGSEADQCSYVVLSVGRYSDPTLKV